MKIEVTQKDISLANKRCHHNDQYFDSNCPIALAVKRKTHRSVAVLDKRIQLFVGPYNTHREYPLPKNAQNFIKRFDKKKRVRPITFEVTPNS